MSEINEMQEFCIYLLARSRTEGQVRQALLQKYGVGLTKDQVTQLSTEFSTQIIELAEDLPRQLKLARKFNQLSLINPLNRLEMLQAASIEISKGEERISKDGIKSRVRTSNSAVALERLLRAVKDEVDSITQEGEAQEETFTLVVDVVSPDQDA